MWADQAKIVSRLVTQEIKYHVIKTSKWIRRVLVPVACIVGSAAFLALAQKSAPSIIDGGKNPELIPDEEVLSLILFTATLPSDPSLATEANKLRAQAYLGSLPLTIEDRAIVGSVALSYRKAHETLVSNGHTSDPSAFQQLKTNLKRSTLADLTAKLTPLGWRKFAALLQSEKRAVKLFPLPPMPVNRPIGGLVGRALNSVAGLFPVSSVFAQSMNPSGATYTAMSVADDGTIISTGTTDATSSCNCHNPNAETTLTSPSGSVTDSGVQSGSGEIAQANAFLTLDSADFVDNGEITATSTHNAYCPIAGWEFINGVQTVQYSPLRLTRAYYKCDTTINGNCSANLLGLYVHRRCNSGRCPTITSRLNNWRFTLQTVAEISGPTFTGCVAEQATAIQQPSCAAPDPIP